MPHRPAPIVVGVVNVTPDSFSDGGDHGDGVAHALALLEAGADWIDVGGESTRPGAAAVDAESEWARVKPVIEALGHETVVSIDTSKASVAARALKAGASVINDVTALSDPEMAAVTADAEQTIIMHMRGTPQTMRTLTEYDDVVAQVADWLVERAALVRSEGVWIDSISFAKTAQQPASLGTHRAPRRDRTAGHGQGLAQELHWSHARCRPGQAQVAAAVAANGSRRPRPRDVAHTRQLLDLLYAIEGAA